MSLDARRVGISILRNLILLPVLLPGILAVLALVAAIWLFSWPWRLWPNVAGRCQPPRAD